MMHTPKDNHMENQQVKPKLTQKQEMSLAVGGILAGWEIDPNWSPRAGDKVVIGFLADNLPAPRLPDTQTITLTPFYILAAVGMKMGGKGLTATAEAAVKKAAMAFGQKPEERDSAT